MVYTFKTALTNEKFSYEQLRAMLDTSSTYMNTLQIEDMLKAIDTNINDITD
jgi:hypothetical protein